MIKTRHYKGYTLIELLIVMTIIAVLASSLFILINPAEIQRRSRDAKRISDLGTVKSAIDLAMADNNAFILTDTVPTGVSFGSVTNFAGKGLDVSKYLPTMPADPRGGGSASIITDGAACTVGIGIPSYVFISHGGKYVVRANLESKTNCKTVTGDGSNNSTYEQGTCINMTCY